MKKSLFILLLCLFYTNCFSQLARPLSDVDQANVEKYEEMVTFYKNHGEYNEAVSHLNKIAFIYWDNQRNDEAVKYFLETIPIYEKSYDLNNIRKAYSNIGLIYLDTEDLNNAHQYFNKSLQVRRELGNKLVIASGLVDLAYVISLQRDYYQAIEYLLEAMDICRENNYESLLLSIYNQLSRNYNNLGMVEKANEYLQKYLTHKDYLATRSIRKDYEEREIQSQVEIRRAQFEKRARELELKLQRKLYQEEQDSIRRVVEAKEYSLLLAEERENRIQQEMESIELDRQLQRTQLEKQEERERTQRIIMSYGIGVFIIGAILLIILYRNYIAKQRANKKLEHINKEIEDKSRQLQEAYYKIEDQNLKITHSINYAKEIQKALFPPRDTLKNFLPESFIFFKPLHVVSGDFYWFKEIDKKIDKKFSEKKYAENVLIKQESESFEKNLPAAGSNNNDFLPIKGDKFIISAVDCTGHGVPGAFMSMIGYNLLDEITKHGITNTDEILSHLHKGIRQTLKQEEGKNRDGMDLSVCLINKEERTLQFSGAQNSIIYIQNGDVNVIKGDRMSIGGVQKETERSFTKTTINIDKPTWFYIFSDGYIDQFGGPNNRKLLLKNFKNLLLDIYKEPMDIQEKLLKQNFFDWKQNEEQIDDVLVIGFKLGGNENS